MKFLKSVATRFYEDEGARIREFCFVFPNRRSGLFFRKYLGEIATTPLFSPGIFTIKDFIISVSGFREADRLDSLFRLFRLYKEISESAESFDDFVFWGDIILDDFNDTDKFLADARLLFANIKDLKEIESDYSFLSESQLEAVKSFWEGFLPADTSENKQKFKLLWQVLYPLYTKFREELFAEKCGNEGMIFRYVAENLSLFDQLSEYRQIVFVGLNALNECEKKILKHLEVQGRADFYWDYFGDFVTDPSNKASSFMNWNIANLPSKREIFFNKYSIPQIEVIGVSSAVMQTRIVSGILEKNESGIENAVILPDERLLIPMLHAIPEKYPDINVTMGYPLKGSQVMALIEHITELNKDKSGFYYKRVLPLLRHNYIKLISGTNAEALLKRIVKENIIVATPSLFDGDPFLKLIFSELPNDTKVADAYFKKLINILDYISENANLPGLEREFLYHIKTSLSRISGIMIPMNLDTAGRLLNQLLSTVTVPFRGEPLSGLQIMGVLETRALDFDNVIYCSVNEGIFPATTNSNSFIPYNLRRGFLLPVKEYNDAIASYHFYRSIYRSKKVWLLYDTRTEGLSTGEASRFILQLKYHYKLPLKESFAAFNVKSSPEKNVEIEKSEEVMKKLDTLFSGKDGKGFSATALGSYILCPLQFYLSYIEEVKEEDEISEEIASNDFGSIFHFVMENLYMKFKGRLVTKENLKQLAVNVSEIEGYIGEGFVKYLNLRDLKGYNLLVKKLIIKYIQLTIDYDLSIAPFEYIDSERRVKTSLLLDNGREVALKGFIDRIDKKGGVVRVVDYKTGRGDIRYRDIWDLFDYKRYNDKKVAFQMLFYSMLLDPSDEISIAPYILRDIGRNGDIQEMVVSRVEIDNFRELIKELICQIFDPEINFTPNKGTKSCEWCPYSSICY